MLCSWGGSSLLSTQAAAMCMCRPGAVLCMLITNPPGPSAAQSCQHACPTGHLYAGSYEANITSSGTADAGSQTPASNHPSLMVTSPCHNINAVIGRAG